MPKFIDFHPGHEMSPEGIQRLTEETKKGVYDEYGVRQLELYYGENGVYCLLEAPDKEAVRKHHKGNCGEIHEVESLL